MTDKAIITQRRIPRMQAEEAESGRAHDVGATVEYRLPHGTLVSGDEQQYAALEQQGFRVKLLRDTNILQAGAYEIDIEALPPEVPSRLEVPKRQVKKWLHHLVQLIGPPVPEWIAGIEERGVDVVESISAYGLFVTGSPEAVAALASLPFVAWVGPYKPAYRIHPTLANRRGKIQYVRIGVYPEEEVDAVKAALERARAMIVAEAPPSEGYQGESTTLIVEVYARSVPALARLPGVRWLEYAAPEPGYDGERESQIVAEDLNPAGTAPVPGYQARLAALDLSGSGVTVAICDSGVDANANNNATGHVDLRGRQTAFVDYTGGGGATDTNGHGTHVAGIAAGNAATGQVDAVAPDDFLWGQGVAPQANYVTQNATAVHQGAPWPPANFGTLTGDAKSNNADAMNNSWWDGDGVGAGYTANARRFDQLVREANEATAALDPLTIVFSAGNSGGAPSTITSPKEAKNLIVVGSSLTWRPGVGFPRDDIAGISHFSSRGPAVDERLLPTVVAPGVDVTSTHSETAETGPRLRVPIAGTGTPDPANPGSFINQYLYMSGTSMSSPHVTGLCALLIEWWRDRTGGRDPSPAMLKALLINGAEDLAGGENWRRVRDPAQNWVLHAGSIYRWDNIGYAPDMVLQENNQLAQVGSLAALVAPGQWFYDNVGDDLYVWTTTGNSPSVVGSRINARDTLPLPSIPNEHQGWGRVSLENIVLQSPDSDRGPRIFSDQRHAFTADLQEYVVRVAPNDAARPMRITLVWTDAPGAAGANPALENDLDLEVTELATGNIYRGNVNFANGFSMPAGPGDAFDSRNNVECVYLQNPAGAYDVRVIAGTLTRNARPPYDMATPWQDFALVIDNAEVPSAAPVSVVPVVDRSGSMETYGYVEITRTSSKQFVDLMNVDDQIGVVSFGSTGDIEYPPGPALETITGPPIRDDAKDEIDDIEFGGCTFMGQGIERARDLLNPVAGTRAMVLLSDGYDNKGCNELDPTRPWARDVAAGLPASMPVYTCAMGATSDQELLADVADDSGGRYYYMPTIDDLFEIYNYIRGRVSGDAIVVNESSMASSSRVAAFVDSLAAEATFSVAWPNPRIRFVPRPPKGSREVSVQLRDPNGRLLHPNASHVRRIEGEGYVIFKLQEPMPGQWYVEVTTDRDTHMRYTVGGFVRSPLRLLVPIFPKRIVCGMPIQISARVLEGRWPIKGFRAKAHVVAPSLDIRGAMRRYRSQLKEIRPPQTVRGDKLPRPWPSWTFCAGRSSRKRS